MAKGKQKGASWARVGIFAVLGLLAVGAVAVVVKFIAPMLGNLVSDTSTTDAAADPTTPSTTAPDTTASGILDFVFKGSDGRGLSANLGFGGK